MSFDIHQSISEDSSGGHLIASLAAEQCITPTQAVERIIDEAAQREASASLAPSHEETPMQLVARLRAQKAAKGEGLQPPLRTDAPERVIGLFGNAPELIESILNVVEARSGRYMGRP